jgi:branched-subunit amino acid transport protein
VASLVGEGAPPMTWLTLAAVGLTTFLLRASFIVFADPQRFPHAFRQALAFVPPAVLAAIVAPGLLLREGSFDLSVDNPRWIAGIVAMGAAAATRSAGVAIACGMAALWTLQSMLAGG